MCLWILHRTKLAAWLFLDKTNIGSKAELGNVQSKNE